VTNSDPNFGRRRGGHRLPSASLSDVARSWILGQRGQTRAWRGLQGNSSPCSGGASRGLDRADAPALGPLQENVVGYLVRNRRWFHVTRDGSGTGVCDGFLPQRNA